jgi:nicotinate-nucleotide adenylyltransferase
MDPISERLGVLGGTFDPVHIGHLVAAVNVRHALGLDRVLLVVANAPWQKSDRRITPAADRLAVVEAAVAGTPGVEASGIEVERGGESYTADTLEALSRPGRELFLIVGSDVAADLHTWRRPHDVARLATLVVVSRGGVAGAGPGALT